MYILLLLIILIVISTITAGIVIRFKEYRMEKKQASSLVKYNLMAFIPVLAGAVILLIPQIAQAVGTATDTNAGLGYIAAALSTGLATIGTGYAVGSVGSSALGAVSEDPKILGKTLIFVGLAEGIAIYGLIVSIMILGRL